ncbi:MAG: glycosyltransferase family 2 protein [Deltaproteobacteria bacterium]|nr:glycosyltransferase family 2 protein [Deltaproteobacteria bacterium]
MTVIVPCYNEEAGLPFLLERLRKMRARNAGDWRFLFVDDGSSDGTFAALLRAAQDEDWVEVVRHPENLGLGAALRTGFEHARSPIVCSIDSDCTYPPEKLPELAAMVGEGAQIVTASAWHPESAAAEGSSIRLWLSRMVSGLYKLLIGQDIYTFTCLFRAYETDAVRRIRFRSSGFAAVAEIMLRAMLNGQRVSEVPMRLESRRFGESKLKVGDAVMAHVRLLLMTAFMVGARQARAVGSRLVG